MILISDVFKYISVNHTNLKDGSYFSFCVLLIYLFQNNQKHFVLNRFLSHEHMLHSAQESTYSHIFLYGMEFIENKSEHLSVRI